jgi:hypothetical protein
MYPLSASDVFLTVAIMSVTFLTDDAQPMRGLGLRKLDG